MLSPLPGEYGRKAETKELAGEHSNERSVRFNWIQRRKTHQCRRTYEDQRDELIGLFER